MTIPRTGTRVVDMTNTVIESPVFLENSCEEKLRPDGNQGDDFVEIRDETFVAVPEPLAKGVHRAERNIVDAERVLRASERTGNLVNPRDRESPVGAVGRRAVSTSILSSDYCKGVAATMRMVASLGASNADAISLARTSLEGLSNAYIAGLRSVSGSNDRNIPGLRPSTSGFGPPSVSSDAADKDMIRMALSKGEYPEGFCYARLLSAEFKVSTSMYLGSWASVMVLLSRSADEFLPIQYLAGYCVKGGGKKRHVLPVSMDRKLEKQNVSVVQFLRNAALSSGWAPGTLGSRLVRAAPLTKSVLQTSSRCDTLEVKLGGYDRYPAREVSRFDGPGSLTSRALASVLARSAARAGAAKIEEGMRRPGGFPHVRVGSVCTDGPLSVVIPGGVQEYRGGIVHHCLVVCDNGSGSGSFVIRAHAAVLLAGTGCVVNGEDCSSSLVVVESDGDGFVSCSFLAPGLASLSVWIVDGEGLSHTAVAEVVRVAFAKI